MNDDTSIGLQCGCGILILIINIIIGTWSVNYLLLTLAGKTIPLIGAILIGMVAGELTIPAAIVVWLLKFFSIM